MSQAGAAAAGQCREELREEGVGYTGRRTERPASIAPWDTGPPSPTDHPPLTVSRAVSVPARFRNVRTLGRLRKL